jgi:hypothetical protein
MRTAVLFVLLILGGCAGHSIECLDSVARSNCAPDTPAGQAMEQQRKVEQTYSEIDDARCKSYGNPGSPPYAQCRAGLQKERLGSATAK